MQRRQLERDYQRRIAREATQCKQECLEALGTGIDHEITRLDVRSVLLALERVKRQDALRPDSAADEE